MWLIPLLLLVTGCHQVKEVPFTQEHFSGEISVNVLALPTNTRLEYKELVQFIQRMQPGYTVALVHEDEELRGDVAWTGMHYEGLRVWMVREGHSKKLFNQAS